MLAEVGEVLPLALGIAISPVPIIATLLLLMAPKAKAASVGFAVGWVAGILVTSTVFVLLSALWAGAGSRDQGPWVGTAKLVLGAGLIVLAVRQWQQRPAPGASAELPGWMAAVDSFGVGRAAGLAFLLAAVNPKNLLLAATAGLSIGQGDHVVATLIVFVGMAAVSVAGLVVAYLLAAERLTPWLQSLRGWLVANNATVMAVLLVVLGTSVIGKALTAW